MTVAWVQTALDAKVPVTGVATSYTWSLFQALTSGNALTGQIYSELGGSGAVVSGITDNAGNTYSILGDSLSGGTLNRVTLFGKANVVGSPTTLTASYSAAPSGSNVYMWGDESSGAGAIDASALFNNTTSTNTPTSGNLSPTTTSDLLLAYWTGEIGKATAGPGFTIRLNDNILAIYSESQQLSTTTPIAGTFTTSVPSTGVLGAIALSPSASCVPSLRLLGVGCGVWAAKKIEENPIITRRRLILPPAIPVSLDSEKKAKLYNQQGTRL